MEVWNRSFTKRWAIDLKCTNTVTAEEFAAESVPLCPAVARTRARRCPCSDARSRRCPDRDPSSRVVRVARVGAIDRAA